MKTVEDILKVKGCEVWSVTPNATVYEAVELLASKGIGALLVLDEKKLVGILSERDYARKIILEGKRSRETKVSEIMVSKVVCVPPKRTVEECMALMTEKRIRHLPVVLDQEVKGIISIGDVVKAVISEKQYIIDQLESYITGHPC